MNPQRVSQLAAHLRKLSPGDRAVLRRGGVEAYAHHSGVGYDILCIVQRELPVDGREAAEEAWMFLASCLAEDPDMHCSRAPFGRALANANVSPSRVNTLLTADLHTHLSFVQATLRQVGSKSGRGPFVHYDWWEVLGLLTEEAEEAEDIRKKIAKDYFAAVRRAA